MPLTPEQVEAIAVEAAVEATKQAVEDAADKAAKKVAMSHEEISNVVAEAVKQTLLQMGMDSQNPIEMQRDFQHLRQWRRAGEDLRNKGMLAILTIFITGLISLVVVGFKQWLNPGG